MAEFSVNTHRRQPYPDHRFRLVMEGRVVAGISQVGALRRDTEVVVHRSGADRPVAVRSPGRSTFAPVVLERGVTHDEAFEEWAGLVQQPGGSDVALASYRRDLRLELHNEAGQQVLAYGLFGCWPSSWQALPELDANGGARVAIQRLELQIEGFERDRAVTEPVEPDGRPDEPEERDG
jgi:phage tail-like protein